jgi:hypothetical protein
MPLGLILIACMMCSHRFRYAIRGLRKSPGFAITSIATLGLGIGITAAIFSVIYGVLLKTPPYGGPDQLCLLWSRFQSRTSIGTGHRIPLIKTGSAMPTASKTSGLFCARTGQSSISQETDSVEQIQSAKVSANVFAVLGTPAALGRTFTAADVSSNANLALVSDHFWKQYFASAPDAIGKKLEIDNTSFQVIRVMPPDFAFPAKESQAWSNAKDTQLWIPINSDPR